MSAAREAEIQAQPLGEGWVEVRIVYQASPESQHQPHHAKGEEARRDIVHFVLAFAASIAASYKAPNLAGEIHRLWDFIHYASQCTSGETHH